MNNKSALKRDHLGTFRISKEIWESFQALAESEGMSASLAICTLIDLALQGKVSLSNINDSTVEIGEVLKKIQELDERVTEIENTHAKSD